MPAFMLPSCCRSTIFCIFCCGPRPASLSLTRGRGQRARRPFLFLPSPPISLRDSIGYEVLPPRDACCRPVHAVAVDDPSSARERPRTNRGRTGHGIQPCHLSMPRLPGSMFFRREPKTVRDGLYEPTSGCHHRQKPQRRGRDAGRRADIRGDIYATIGPTDPIGAQQRIRRCHFALGRASRRHCLVLSVMPVRPT